MSEGHDHYSYTLYADPATARQFDEKRFGGPIGRLVARQQATVLDEFLGDIQGRSILDVGTGTGRAALILAAAGAEVTGVDASDEMLAVARQQAVERHLEVTFRAGDAHALEFPDRAFDIVVSLRVLMHTPRWRQCIDELCRVAKSSIVVDYPSARSAALVQSLTRKVLHTAGVRTEPYRVFSDRDIIGAIAQHGFRVRRIDRQFVLPIAFHKFIGSPSFTRASEGALARLGLLRLFGSPVTLVADRCASS